MNIINIVYTNKTSDRMEHKRCIDLARKDFLARSHGSVRKYGFDIVSNEDQTFFYTTRKFMERAIIKGTCENEVMIATMEDYPSATLMVC